MNRNYETPNVAAQWASSRNTSEAVAMAIHAIADSNRSPEEIWEAPTAAEFEHVEMALSEYCRMGDIDAGEYHWGDELLEVLAE